MKEKLVTIRKRYRVIVNDIFHFSFCVSIMSKQVEISFYLFAFTPNFSFPMNLVGRFSYLGLFVKLLSIDSFSRRLVPLFCFPSNKKERSTRKFNHSDSPCIFFSHKTNWL